MLRNARLDIDPGYKSSKITREAFGRAYTSNSVSRATGLYELTNFSGVYISTYFTLTSQWRKQPLAKPNFFIPKYNAQFLFVCMY